jgi:hypothetical protein
MRPIVLCLVFLLLCFLTAAGIRFRQLRADARRREDARTAWKARRTARLQSERDRAMLREIDRCFPFLADEVRRLVKRGRTVKDAAQEGILSVSGVHLGDTDGGLPVVLPASLRSRHVLLLGKSGYGKSSTMVHMICEDLR